MSEVKKGVFIALEGVDGAGKTTQIKRLELFLKEQGIDVVVTREPGGTPTAEKIRGLFGDTGGDHISTNAELLLMFAARQIHLDNVIRPALVAGKWVICDRFINSTYAYQVASCDDGDPELFYALTFKVIGNTVPDMTITIDVPDHVGEERSKAARPGALARWDAMPSEKRQRINESIRQLAQMPKNWIIDGNRLEWAVTNSIIDLIETEFNLGVKRNE